MLSFKILTDENKEEIIASIEGENSCPDAADIVGSFFELSRDEGLEIALNASHGCLLARIFDDGRYSFVYPIELFGADVDAALLDLAEYARRELVALHLTDVPREELQRLGKIFPHIEARAYDDDEDGFVALVCSECDMLSDIPSASDGAVSLGELREEDAREYARLCRDEAVNRFWGYDYKADAERVEDGYFLAVAESELRRGVALSLAVRYEGRFAGEAVIFDFDYFGGAMAAIRLLPEMQGRGIGSQALSLLIGIARDMGLLRLRAEVMSENIASVRMTEKQMPLIGEPVGRLQFELKL